jgi:ketosteroid isomerase-like protein
MMAIIMTNEQVRSILKIYGRAWESQDPELIISIFTEDATYQEGPFAIPMQGREAIKSYWLKKVVEEQKEIRFTLLNYLTQDDQAAAEWNGDFVDVLTNEHVHMYEAAFLTFKDGRISSLRETWRSQRTSLV